MSYKSELIRKLFSDRLKKDELKDLSEIDMIERKMKVQWEEQNPIAENSERQVFEPITLTTYATMSYIPKFQIGNETVTIFRRWACPTLTAVCLPNFRVQR